jgi:hypothetical protein
MYNSTFYQEIIVESISYFGGGSSSSIRVRPLSCQGFPDDVYVECSKEMRTSHPVGTKFKLRAKVTTREGGKPFLYSSFQWNYNVVTNDEAERFIAENFAE